MVRVRRPFFGPTSSAASWLSALGARGLASIVPSSGYRNFSGAVLPVGRSHSTISSGPSA